MNGPDELALPPFVVTLIFPVVAPLDTVAVICVAEFTVKVAFTPLNVTLDTLSSNPLPVMVTVVPTGPLVGLTLVSTGSILKACLLLRTVLLFNVTVTVPVVAASGTVAVK